MNSKVKSVMLLASLVTLCLLTLAFGQNDELWRGATAPFVIDATRDQASHPDYRIEQWSYSGNLVTTDGRRFGYQFKFIRGGINYKPDNPSRWAVRDLFITQLAVTDVDGKQFKTAERINRAGINWAGVAGDSLHLWNDDWEVRPDALLAAENGLGLELRFDNGRPAVAHGVDGVFQKGALPFNTSHLFSVTRIPTSGALIIDGQRIEVTGSSWLDHEFGSSVPEEGQRGWDWFTIELDDGTDLMIYQIRLADGTRDEYSIATLLRADGKREPLRSEEFEMEPLTRWTSPTSGGAYPIRWRIKIPSQQTDLEVNAAIDDQELRTVQSLGITYWRGIVEVNGTRHGETVNGRGMMELTGYAGPSTLQ